MKRLVLAICALVALVYANVAYSDVISSEGVNTELITLMTNGPANERINVVFVPEFYGNRREEFVADVNLVKDALFEVEPFKTYKKYFNTSAIWMTFDESPSSPMIYFCGGVNGSGICNNWDNMDLSKDIVGRYYSIKTTAVVFLYYKGLSGFGGPNSDWPKVPICYTQVDMGQMHEGEGFSKEFEVFCKTASKRSLVHEFGHAFGFLGDERSNAVARPAIGTELAEDGVIFPNLTFESRRDRVRWKNWIEPATPMPTPDTPENANKVGLFVGGLSRTSGIYRSMSLCMMNRASSDTAGDKDPFCVVCREYLTKYTCKFSTNLEGTSFAVGNSSTTFKARLLSGVGMGFEVKWMIDGAVSSSRIVSSGADSFLIRDSDIGFGAHTIRVEVRDTTSFVRDDPQKLLVESYEWPVVNTPTADFNGNGRVDFEDFFLFVDHFGMVVSGDPEAVQYDLDSDGKISFEDFFLFAEAFTG